MTAGANFDYQGSELEVFAEASNWRWYWQSNVAPYIGTHVLEVGAGIGTITRNLCQGPIARWVALEPDKSMANRLCLDRTSGLLPSVCQPRCGTTADLKPDELFDTILYIDVIEHIKEDHEELARAGQHLSPTGHLIVLVPAHQLLYTAFDAAIGHFRRYGMRQLLDLKPPYMTLRSARYLDSVGLLASAGNKLLLRKAHPTKSQIKIWDSWMIPLSRRLDPLFGHRAGKSAIAVWQKTSNV